jgi:hypothetical protein
VGIYEIDILKDIKPSESEIILKTDYLNDSIINFILECNNLTLILNKKICEENYFYMKKI